MASERGHNTLENQKGKQLHAEEAVGTGWSCFRMDSVPQELSLVKMGLGNLIYSHQAPPLKSFQNLSTTTLETKPPAPKPWGQTLARP